MFKTDETRDSSDLQGKSGGYGYTTRVPLKGLSPGIYVLKVEARSRLGAGPTADRQVQFRITEPASAAGPEVKGPDVDTVCRGGDDSRRSSHRRAPSTKVR